MPRSQLGKIGTSLCASWKLVIAALGWLYLSFIIEWSLALDEKLDSLIAKLSNNESSTNGNLT
jgi:hypothetical protein